MMSFPPELANRLSILIRIPCLDIDNASDVALTALDRPTKLGDEVFRTAFLEIISNQVLEELRSATSTGHLFKIIQSVDRASFSNYDISTQKSLRDTFRHLIIFSKTAGFFTATPRGTSSNQAKKYLTVENPSKQIDAQIPIFRQPSSALEIYPNPNLGNHLRRRYSLIVCSAISFAAGLILRLLSNGTLLPLGLFALLVGVPFYIISCLKKDTNPALRVFWTVVALILSFIFFLIGASLGLVLLV